MSEGYRQRTGGRRLGRRAFLGASAGSAGLAAFLAACGGANNNKSASSAVKPSASAAAAVAPSSAAPSAAAASGGSPAAAPAAANLPAAGAGGSMRGHDNGDPVSFDLIKTWSYRTIMYTSMVYPRLLKFDTKPGVGPIDFLITADLAQKLPEQPDPTTYIFKLNQAKWENKAPLNGRALTADDVAKNWERFAKDHPSRNLMTDVTKVEAVDAGTVKFTLAKPLGPFTAHIGHQGLFYIQPPELFSGGQLEKDMWSAGPFLFKGYDIGAKVTFERNPDYFIKDRPLLKEYIYNLIPDASAAASALRSKQIDTLTWTAVVLPNDVASLKKDLPDSTFLPYAGQGNGWFGMDLTDARFKDKRVRQAISMALNRDDIVKVGAEGQWALPYGVLSSFYTDPKKNEFPNAKYYQNNVKDAKALLDAAGFKPTESFDMLASAIWTPVQLQQAQLIQQQLKDIGIQTQIKTLEFAEFYAKTTVSGTWKGGFAASANRVGADPNEYFSIYWAPETPTPIAPGLKDLIAQDSELLNLFEQQKRELDVAKRKAIVKDITNVMADRMYNAPTTVGINYHVHRANVKNMNWIFTYGLGGEYLLDSYIQG